MVDHCTLFPEGWWSHCCEGHDADYAAQAARHTADLELLQCVATSGDGLLVGAASMVIGMVIFAGVRVFGGRFYRKAGRNSGDSSPR